MYGSKMTIANRAHHRIDFPDLLVHRANAADILDVRVNIATCSAYGDNFVPGRQRVYSRFANCAFTANHNNFHLSPSSLEHSNRSETRRQDDAPLAESLIRLAVVALGPLGEQLGARLFDLALA